MGESNREQADTRSKRPKRLGRGLAGLITTSIRSTPEASEASSEAVPSAVPAHSEGNDLIGDSDPPQAISVDAPQGSTEVVDLDAISDNVSDRSGSIEAELPLRASAEDAPAAEVPRGTTRHAVGSSRSEGYQVLSIDEILPNPHQPREYFDQAGIEQLASSIKSSGLIQPITVRRMGDQFELVAGERRLKACHLAGMTEIPAIVRDISDRATAEWALVENLQREDLNPLERANGLRRLIDEFKLTHQQAAEAVGLERASVSNLLRLLDLDDSTASLVARGTLGQGHAKVLLSVQDVSIRGNLCQATIARNWSVRRLEMEVRKLVSPDRPEVASSKGSPRKHRAHYIDQLEQRLSEHLGTRVQISLSRREGQGRLLIDFHSLEHFDDLMQRIGFEAADG